MGLQENSVQTFQIFLTRFFIYICGILKSRQPRHQNLKFDLDTIPDVFLLVECFNFSNSLKFLTRVIFFGLFWAFFGGPLKILICHGRNVITVILTLQSI